MMMRCAASSLFDRWDAITSEAVLPVGTTVLVLEKVGLDTYAVAAVSDANPGDA